MRALVVLCILVLACSELALAQVEVGVGDGRGFGNEPVVVPVNVTSLSGHDVISFTIDIGIDSDALELIGVETDGSLWEGHGSPVVNFETLRVVGYSTTTVDGSGPLIYLVLKRRPGFGGTCEVCLATVLINGGSVATDIVDCGSVRIIGASRPRRFGL